MALKALTELRLDGLRDGRFLEAAEADFRRMATGMVGYADRHPGQAGGIKGRLTIEVEFERTAQGGWVIAATTKLKMPGRPAMVEFPVAGANDMGEMTLFQTPSAETTNPNPHQEPPALDEG